MDVPAPYRDVVGVPPNQCMPSGVRSRSNLTLHRSLGIARCSFRNEARSGPLARL